MSARLILVAAAAVCAACGPAPAPVASTHGDAAQQKWYAETLTELTKMNSDAERAFQAGKSDEAAALLLKGQPLADSLVGVPRPALAAVEAASDLDQLYGQMLLSNRNYGWARLEFQKNRARWKTWQPQTEETARRLKLAEDAIAECDRRMAE